MKFLLRVILIGILTFAFEQFLPWWSIALAAFTGGFVIKASGINSFLAGALGVGLVWLWWAFRIDMTTGSFLTIKMASLFNIDNIHLMIIITAFWGGIIGAFSSWTGNNLLNLFEKPRKRTSYYS